MPRKNQPDIEPADPEDFTGQPPGTDEGDIRIKPEPPGNQPKNSAEKRKSVRDTIPQIGSIEDDERSLDESGE